MVNIRFDICNIFISALELFKFYNDFFFACNLGCFTSNPQRLVCLLLVGEYVPIFPTEFLGFRIRRRHKNFVA